MTTIRADAPATPPAVATPPPAVVRMATLPRAAVPWSIPLPASTPFVRLAARGAQAGQAAPLPIAAPAAVLPAPAVPGVTVVHAPDMGFAAGSATTTVLHVGQAIARYGPPEGRFATTPWTRVPELSLPPDRRSEACHVYTVQRPIPVRRGRVAPWFGEPGGGVQYVLPSPVDRLVRDGFLTETSP